MSKILRSFDKIFAKLHLSFSIGCIMTDMNLDKDLDDYIREADETMYKEKQIKKVNRTE